MLASDKIFTTVSSSAFVHMRHYNQHHIKKILRGALRQRNEYKATKFTLKQSQKIINTLRK